MCRYDTSLGFIVKVYAEQVTLYNLAYDIGTEMTLCVANDDAGRVTMLTYHE